MGSEPGDLQSDIDKNLARAEQDFRQELRKRAGRWTAPLIAMLAGSGKASKGFREWLGTFQPETAAKERQVVYRLARYVLFLRRQRQLIGAGEHLEAVFRTLYWLPGPESVVKGLDDSIFVKKLRMSGKSGGRRQAAGIYEAVRGLWSRNNEKGLDLTVPQIWKELGPHTDWEDGLLVTTDGHDYAIWRDGSQVNALCDPPFGRHEHRSGKRTLQRYLKEIKAGASKSK